MLYDPVFELTTVMSDFLYYKVTFTLVYSFLKLKPNLTICNSDSMVNLYVLLFFNKVFPSIKIFLLYFLQRFSFYIYLI